MKFEQFKKIQLGSLSLRRWRKRAILLFIAANIWLDQLIIAILRDTQQVIAILSEKITDIENYEYSVLGGLKKFKVGKEIQEQLDTDYLQERLLESLSYIDWLVWALLFFSILFWMELIMAIRFLIADYKVILKEENRRQWFIIIAIVFNIISYILLNMLFPVVLF